MNFEQPQESEEPKNENIEETEKIEEKTYKKAREQADIFLDNFEFSKDEEIVKVNSEKAKDEVPVFFSPGWGTREVPKSITSTIANEGRNVISTVFSREEILKDSGEEGDIPAAEMQKALAIIDIINKEGIDKVDAVGHSEGGLNLAIAACLYPEKFRNIIFVASAGMIGKDSYLDLVKRFAIDEGREEMKNSNNPNVNLNKSIKDILKHILMNPSLTHKEIKAMTKIDFFKMTKYLKEQGVGVGLVCGANDKVFPMEEVIKNANQGNIDAFISTKANHGSLVFDEKYPLLAENLLDNMAKRKK
ncbi:MAG: alpha/beta hydrolase [Candidatus Paceibacterota bacterium]|jgi:hypothetical protein